MFCLLLLDVIDMLCSEMYFFGICICGLCKCCGLILVELVVQSEFIVGYISQLECNLVYLLILVLFNIVCSFGVIIQWFFVSEVVVDLVDVGYVVWCNMCMSVYYEDGIIDELFILQFSCQLEIFYLCFLLGIYSQQSYSYEGEEVGYIFSGIFEFWVGDCYFQFCEGDSFSYFSQELYCYGNLGDSDILVFWVIILLMF